MDDWGSFDADDRQGGPTTAAGPWARQMRAFFAGVAITSVAAVLLVFGGSTGAEQLSVGTSAVASTTASTTSPVVASTTTTTSPVATTTTIAPGPAHPSTPALAPSCTTPEKGVASTPTKDALIRRLVGTWLVCKSPSVFGTKEVGMQILSDGRWSKLTRNSAGRLTPVPGWGNQGTWEVIDTSLMNGPGVFQVDFHIDGSGTVMSLPVFSSGPPKMRLNNEGVFVADYVPVSHQVVAPAL